MKTLAKLNSYNDETSEDWLRVSLAPYVELHYRPAQTPERENQIARLVADASRLLSDENVSASKNYQANNINWIGSLALL